MAKSLCKYRRVEIADQFAKISRLVSEPRYICSSCARSASDKAYLCKPSALSAREATKGKETTASCRPVNPAPPGRSEGEEAMPPLAATKKQLKQLKKLAKKKNKRLKKAAKAVQRYEKALKKANKALSL